MEKRILEQQTNKIDDGKTYEMKSQWDPAHYLKFRTPKSVWFYAILAGIIQK